MKYTIHITGIVDTDDYTDVQTTRQVHALVKAMIRHEAELPPQLTINVHPVRYLKTPPVRTSK